jgi:hypothetical protein
MLQLKIVAIAPLYPDGFFIQWSLTDATESGTYVFDVYRSGGQEGPWDQIAVELSDQYAFIDKFAAPYPKTTQDVLRPNQLTLFREYVYKVVVRSPSGTVAEAIDGTRALQEGFLNDQKMAQYRRKCIRDFRLSLKFNGTRCVILKRRHWGVRCICVDKKTKEIIRSSCTKCTGTGIVGGYWNPISTYTRRNVAVNTSAVTNEGKSDSNDAKFWMPDFPSLEVDDVIVFMKENSRWRIDQVAQTQIRLQDVHQVISAQSLDHGHILYRLPVDPTKMNPLY